MRLAFGDCVLDRNTRQLLSRGAPVHVTPKALDLLDLLLAARPRAISKEEIQDRLWPDVLVSEGTLTSLLAEVRSAIGDDPKRSRFVRTVHRFGYAFSGSVEESRDEPGGPRDETACRLVWGTRDVALKTGETVLGRDPNGDVFIDHPSVSRRHARLTVSETGAVLEDLESKNGTFLGEKRISTPHSLADGDDFRLGSVPLRFRILAAPNTTATVDR